MSLPLYKYSLLLAILFLVGLPSLMSQELDTVNQYKVRLVSGDVYKGRILASDDNEIKLLFKNGYGVVIKRELIEDVAFHKASKFREDEVKKVYNPMSGRVYYGGSLLYNTNTVAPLSGKLMGLGGNIKVGYALDAHWSAGIYSGIESYYNENGEVLIPVMSEIIYYLKKSDLSPYINVGFGYGFGVQSSANEHLVDHKGGWAINPNIGVRLPSWYGMHLIVGVGAKWQENSFDIINGNEISHLDIMYKRLTMNVSFVF